MSKQNQSNQDNKSSSLSLGEGKEHDSKYAKNKDSQNHGDNNIHQSSSNHSSQIHTLGSNDDALGGISSSDTSRTSGIYLGTGTHSDFNNNDDDQKTGTSQPSLGQGSSASSSRSGYQGNYASNNSPSQKDIHSSGREGHQGDHQSNNDDHDRSSHGSNQHEGDSHNRQSSSHSKRGENRSNSSRHHDSSSNTFDDMKKAATEGTQEIKEQALNYADDLMGYVEKNPIKSIMYALFTGLVVGLIVKK